jgi:hypothetical protein
MEEGDNIANRPQINQTKRKRNPQENPQASETIDETADPRAQ